MALEDTGMNGMVMPVSPMYGNGYGGNGMFGGDGWAWIILLLLLCGNRGFGGYGSGDNGGVGGLYPWMNQTDTVNGGFQNLATQNAITGIQNGVNGIATQLCNGFAGVNATVNSGFANAETASNARQMANMQMFNQMSSQFSDCCCENRLGLADLKYTVATENCADRQAAYQNTRDIIDSQTRGIQTIMDKLCALELDGVKNQLAQANRENTALQNQINMATMRESQTAQNALFQQGLNQEVDALYNRLQSCPVNTIPVYGSQPVFTCNNNGYGCGCNA